MPPADCRATAVRTPIRGGKGEGMNRRKLSHVIAAGMLAALLAMPGPVMATTNRDHGPVDLWSWLAGLWSRGTASLGLSSGLEEKAGPGIDPNGGSPAGSGGSTSQSTPA